MVRALERNKSELIDPFLVVADRTPLLSETATPELIEKPLRLIDQDVGHGRVFSPDKLRLFGEAQAQVDQLCREWGKAAKRLERSCNANRPNLATLAKQLNDLRRVNDALAVLVARRYAELVTKR